MEQVDEAQGFFSGVLGKSEELRVLFILFNRYYSREYFPLEELAKIAKVDKDKLQEILNNLSQCGFVSVRLDKIQEGKGIRYEYAWAEGSPNCRLLERLHENAERLLEARDKKKTRGR